MDQLVVSENALVYLNATRPWVKFLAIVGFVFTGLMILFGIIMTFAFSALPHQQGTPAISGPIFGILYLICAGLYVMPCLFMYRYATAIAAIPVVGQSALEDALRNQKSFWKFMGITMLVMLCLYAVFIVFGILIVVMAAASHH